MTQVEDSRDGVLLLQEFVFTIRYKKGIKNTIAEAISRLPIFGETNVELITEIPCYLIDDIPIHTAENEGDGAGDLGAAGIGNILQPSSVTDQIYKSTNDATIDRIVGTNSADWFCEEKLDDEDCCDKTTAHTVDISEVTIHNLQSLSIQELLEAQHKDKESQDIIKTSMQMEALPSLITNAD